jgi:SAM-dependent methyltransferase
VSGDAPDDALGLPPAGADSARIGEKIAGYYRRRLEEHGATPRGVDWKDEASQRLRLDVLLDLAAPGPDDSVLDVGCGYGEFLRTLRARGHRGTFVGYDLEPAMIDAARRVHGGDARAEFLCGPAIPRRADWVVASGIFNVRPGIDDAMWRDHVALVTANMWDAAARGIAFNCLSLHSDADRRAAHLHYADPGETIGRCGRTMSRHVALRQDYGLWEFTIAVRREPAEAGA